MSCELQRFWRGLEEVPCLATVAAHWRSEMGAAFDVLAGSLLAKQGEAAGFYPCPECRCSHRVVDHGGGDLVGVCECEDSYCDDVSLTLEDVALWAVNWRRLGRSVARAFGCEEREMDFQSSLTRQIGSFGVAAVPVVLLVGYSRQHVHGAVRELVATLRQPFALLVPTSRFVDAGVIGLMSGVQAKWFDLQTHLGVLPSGAFHARRSGGELFSSLLPQSAEAVDDGMARGLFALVKQLDSDNPVRKAPIVQVFRLYCVEGLSRAEVAKRCGCVPALITLRLQSIEQKLGRKASELRVISSHFERMEDSLRDGRARKIDRRGEVRGERWEE